MLGNEVSISEALNVSLGSIILVFALLFLLSLILSSFKHIFKAKKIEVIEEVNSIQEIETCRNEIEITSLEEEDDIVACLAATIVASYGNKNSRIHVRSIKRII